MAYSRLNELVCTTLSYSLSNTRPATTRFGEAIAGTEGLNLSLYYLAHSAPADSIPTGGLLRHLSAAGKQPKVWSFSQTPSSAIRLGELQGLQWSAVVRTR